MYSAFFISPLSGLHETLQRILALLQPPDWSLLSELFADEQVADKHVSEMENVAHQLLIATPATTTQLPAKRNHFQATKAHATRHRSLQTASFVKVVMRWMSGGWYSVVRELAEWESGMLSTHAFSRAEVARVSEFVENRSLVSTITRLIHSAELALPVQMQPAISSFGIDSDWIPTAALLNPVVAFAQSLSRIVEVAANASFFTTQAPSLEAGNECIFNSYTSSLAYTPVYQETTAGTHFPDALTASDPWLPSIGEIYGYRHSGEPMLLPLNQPTRATWEPEDVRAFFGYREPPTQAAINPIVTPPAANDLR